MDERTQREKQRLRQALRELTNGLPEAYISRSDLGIEKNLLALEEWKQARSVFIYVSTGREPDTRGMLKTALDSGKTVAVPRVTGSRPVLT